MHTQLEQLILRKSSPSGYPSLPSFLLLSLLILVMKISSRSNMHQGRRSYKFLSRTLRNILGGLDDFSRRWTLRCNHMENQSYHAKEEESFLSWFMVWILARTTYTAAQPWQWKKHCHLLHVSNIWHNLKNIYKMNSVTKRRTTFI